MKFTFDGIRAGLVIGALLTGWSFAAVSSAMSESSDAAGFLYVGVAFGLLTLPFVGWGAALGVIADLWRGATRRGRMRTIADAVKNDPDADRFAAALILAVPILAGVVGLAVGGAHFVITSKFVRVGFQSAGLLLLGFGATIGAALATPLIHLLTSQLVKFIPRGGSTVTQRLGVGLVAVGVVGALGGSGYAASLDVFDGTMLAMALTGVIGTAGLGVLFAKFGPKNFLWSVGIPVAGLAISAATALMAGGWASSTSTMREAVTKQSKLVAFEARFLSRFFDADGDGFASKFGGADCDDTNDAIYPGARETPGNGIDESCSGADAELPSGDAHPSRPLLRAAIAAGAAAAKKQAEQIPDPPKNLVVLLVDTLRWDHLGIGGYDRDTSPNIDAIAKDGTIFAQAYATSPHTPRSIPAIFISRYASRTAWKGGTKGSQYNYPKLLPENVSMFEVLAEKGHRNFGMSSHFYFDPKRGLQEGFESWDNEGAGTIAESNDDIASPRTWAKLEPLIDQLAGEKEKPFSVFVHLFEPHAKWIKHDEFPFSGKDSRIDAYDSEIAYVDSYVGKIVQKLKDTGLWDNTVFAIVSDHGEGFNEHGYFFHGQTIYNEIIHVPMIVRVPGWPHRTIETATSITDLAPTILDLFDYPIPEEFDGVSLEPAMLGESLSERPVYSELLPYTSWKEHHKAVILGKHKFISVYSAGSEELYDLEADPGEQKNIVKEDPETAAKMRKLLEEFTQLP